MSKPVKKKPRPKLKAARKRAKEITPLQFVTLMQINMQEASKIFEGPELIQAMAVVYENAKQIAETEAGISTFDDRPTKAIGMLMQGISKLAAETGREPDAVIIELLDKLGAPHGMPHVAWN